MIQMSVLFIYLTWGFFIEDRRFLSSIFSFYSFHQFKYNTQFEKWIWIWERERNEGIEIDWNQPHSFIQLTEMNCLMNIHFWMKWWVQSHIWWLNLNMWNDLWWNMIKTTIKQSIICSFHLLLIWCVFNLNLWTYLYLWMMMMMMMMMMRMMMMCCCYNTQSVIMIVIELSLYEMRWDEMKCIL